MEGNRAERKGGLMFGKQVGRLTCIYIIAQTDGFKAIEQSLRKLENSLRLAGGPAGRQAEAVEAYLTLWAGGWMRRR
eukprot:2726836-Pleurochrysis_carterae.AAC.1